MTDDPTAVSGVEELDQGIVRIPVPLDGEPLRVVNAYALTGPDGRVDLIDGGAASSEAGRHLAAGLERIGYELGDVRNIFLTHYHRDHYTLAVELRRQHGSTLQLGEAEYANLQTARDVLVGGREPRTVCDLRRAGARDLLDRIDGAITPRQDGRSLEDPDRWIEDGGDLVTQGRSLRAIHTPGHTRGHLVFRDAANRILFSGGHVLSHVTPAIGFEPTTNRLALRDYLDSLRLLLKLPDTRLLPAYGPVRDSTHQRVHELLAHHDDRLAAMYAAVGAGNHTSYQVARTVTWARRARRFAELDARSQYMACAETNAHLALMAARGQLHRTTADDETDFYTI